MRINQFQSERAALRFIKSVESDPAVHAVVILNRHTDPRWKKLQEAYSLLRGPLALPWMA